MRRSQGLIFIFLAISCIVVAVDSVSVLRGVYYQVIGNGHFNAFYVDIVPETGEVTQTYLISSYIYASYFTSGTYHEDERVFYWPYISQGGQSDLYTLTAEGQVSTFRYNMTISVLESVPKKNQRPFSLYSVNQDGSLVSINPDTQEVKTLASLGDSQSWASAIDKENLRFFAAGWKTDSRTDNFLVTVNLLTGSNVTVPILCPYVLDLFYDPLTGILYSVNIETSVQLLVHQVAPTGLCKPVMKIDTTSNQLLNFDFNPETKDLAVFTWNYSPMGNPATFVLANLSSKDQKTVTLDPKYSANAFAVLKFVAAAE